MQQHGADFKIYFQYIFVKLAKNYYSSMKKVLQVIEYYSAVDLPLPFFKPS